MGPDCQNYGTLPDLEIGLEDVVVSVARTTWEGNIVPSLVIAMVISRTALHICLI